MPRASLSIFNRIIVISTCIIFASFPLGYRARAQQSKFILMGGGAPTASIIEQVLSLGGGADVLKAGSIGVLTTASAEPQKSFRDWQKDFAAFGIELNHIPLTKENNNSQAMVESIRQLKVLLLTGGDQFRHQLCLKNQGHQSAVLQTIHERVKNGELVLMGSSAGTAVQAEQMITGGSPARTLLHGIHVHQPGNLQGLTYLPEGGLGIWPFPINLDTHRWERGRDPRLAVFSSFTGRVGIGIPRETALVVVGNKAKVVGNYHVSMIVPHQPHPIEPRPSDKGFFPMKHRWKNLGYSLLSDGDSINLDTFEIIPAPAKKRLTQRRVEPGQRAVVPPKSLDILSSKEHRRKGKIKPIHPGEIDRVVTTFAQSGYSVCTSQTNKKNPHDPPYLVRFRKRAGPNFPSTFTAYSDGQGKYTITGLRMDILPYNPRHIAHKGPLRWFKDKVIRPLTVWKKRFF